MTYNHPKTITPISCIFYGAKSIVFLDQWSVDPGLFTALAVGLAGPRALRGNLEVTTTSSERFMSEIATHEQNHKAMINEGVIVLDNIYSSVLCCLLFLLCLPCPSSAAENQDKYFHCDALFTSCASRK